MSNEPHININSLSEKFKTNLYESISKIENLVNDLEKISEDRVIQDTNKEIISNLNNVVDDLRGYFTLSEEE